MIKQREDETKCGAHLAVHHFNDDEFISVTHTHIQKRTHTQYTHTHARKSEAECGHAEYGTRILCANESCDCAEHGDEILCTRE